MHSEEAGRATGRARMKREARTRMSKFALLKCYVHYLQISHHTGAQLIAFPFQIMELMKKFKQPRPVQNMYRQVPVFHASKCQGNGMAQSTKPMKANAEKTSLGGACDISKIQGLSGIERDF
jgi:hypothetical protein